MAKAYFNRQPYNPDTIQLSKSIISTFERCQLAYYFEKVERRQKEVPDSPAQIKGTAAHKAVEMLIRSNNPNPSRQDRELIVQHALKEFSLGAYDEAEILDWALEAEDFARNRGGEFRWVEQLMGMKNRLPGMILWGKFDAAVANGSVAPLEIIDWTFGKPRVGNEQDLLHAVGTYAYRLIAGSEEAALRPIAITEVHVPTMSVLTVIPDDKTVSEGWSRIKQAGLEIKMAKDNRSFPATVGNHCRWCSYRITCPAFNQAPENPPPGDNNPPEENSESF